MFLSFIQLFHDEQIFHLKPDRNTKESDCERLILCHREEKKYEDDTAVRVTHYEAKDWWASYPCGTINGTAEGFCGSPGVTFYSTLIDEKSLQKPYLLLLHRFGVFEDENGKTTMGAGIRIDLFLQREFGKLLDKPKAGKDLNLRIDSWKKCRNKFFSVQNSKKRNCILRC